MKNHLIISFALLLLMLANCNTGQDAKDNLQATDFAAKIKELPGAPIIDVRTPEEFVKGHLVNARNIDWNGHDFEKQISRLDKTKPVFVYCLKGSRSSDAADKMRSEGFTTVYQLKGGITKWRAAGLPETMDNAVR